MSHLTAKPLAALHQLATDLENLAFSKAQGNQASQLLQSSTSHGSQVAPYLTSSLLAGAIRQYTVQEDEEA